MITNERQYRITKAQLSKLRQAITAFDVDEAAQRTGSKILARGELDALKSEEEVLSEQVREYEALKSGAVTVLEAENLAELPRILIQARIAQGLTQSQLAKKLGVKEQQIQRYESEGYASANLRRLAEVAEALDLNIRKVAELRPKKQKRGEQKPKSIDWSRFPVKEMYRRNWFEGFSGSLKEAMAEAESLVEDFVTSVKQRPALALHRRRVRSGSIVNPFALLAWECRVLKLAKMSQLRGTYQRSALDDDWLRGLIRESHYPDGPIRAREYLGEAGISLVVEPHLLHTHLDGAALLHEGTPVIGMTLRYDRVDNFWFVLAHELIHVMKHLGEGKVEDIFDELPVDVVDEPKPQPDQLEREADELAGEALIPKDRWETALARYLRTSDSVNLVAKELGISPAIIAGRIRNEAKKFAILSDMVGQGEVRKQFPDVNFGPWIGRQTP